MQAAFARFSLARKTNPHASLSSCPTADFLGILSVNDYRAETFEAVGTLIFKPGGVLFVEKYCRRLEP